jgi:multidrug transporter EmrE-like cation transporter
LAIPFWVEVAANFVEWLAFVATMTVVTTWRAPLDVVGTVFVLLLGAIVTAPVAIAYAIWERRSARRALEAEAR